jgi:hypothetical protein
MIRQVLLLSLLFFIVSCDRDYDFEYDIIITDEATNLDDLNSSYDDYNSNLPYPASRTEIFFSSKRASHDNFDLVAAKLDFSYHLNDDVLNMSVVMNDEPSRLSKLLFPKINNANNQLGPYTYHTGDDLLFLYATEVNGSFAINAIECTNWNYSANMQEISDPFTVATINEIGDNLYPSVSAEKNEMFFCSNRNGTDFNIYSAKYGAAISKQSLVAGQPEEVKMIGELSGAYDDKCPFVDGNLMVFTSNRPGGFGGYDLWYSFYENGVWNSPVNFGNRINSEFDEYRPIVFQLFVLERMVMIFSSNRPGGVGGYDLYAVRLDALAD